ncbi:PIR protein [Plasmodium brasilianum]|uniref:PIR protein n=1 Tax=Plasmodium brasilianum TaxID=5824 RepID=A0ACB9Y8M0_PLABR|nr:PIR protein [Plasmodium brasilianum]
MNNGFYKLKDNTYNHLPSYKFYEQLNSDINEDDNESVYWDSVEPSFDKTLWARDVFLKLERNVLSVNRNRIEDVFSKKHCYDLNYWLYEQVYKNFDHNEKDENFYKTIDIFEDGWKRINNSEFPNEDNVCHPDHTLVDMEYLKDVKNLFDLIEDYVIIKAEVIRDTNNACYKYIEYLKQKVPLYYEWENVCTVEEDNICTRYIDDYTKYNPRNVLENLSVVGLSLASVFNDCYQNIITVFQESEKLPPRTELKQRNALGQIESTVVKVGRTLAEIGDDGMQSGDIFIGVNDFVYSLIYAVKRLNSYVFDHFTTMNILLLFISGRSMSCNDSKKKK